MTESTTPPIRPIRSSPQLRFLSDEQLESIQEATLRVLEETGVHCPSRKALGIYAENGAHVDYETKVVKIPAEIVVECMSNAPRFYTMGARDPACDLELKSILAAAELEITPIGPETAFGRGEPLYY